MCKIGSQGNRNDKKGNKTLSSCMSMRKEYINNMKSFIIFFSVFTFMTLFIWSAKTSATPNYKGAYFYSGDGTIMIGRGRKGKIVKVEFRDSEGNYNIEGLKTINRLYGSPWSEKEKRISVRLIELLDYIEDHFRGSGIYIVSGYRSPSYNKSLRRKGSLAASSSLHIDAEAVDIIMNGVSSADIYEYLRPRECCGVGYYHGKTIHIDTGPPRFWDETSSGTEKKEPPLNEKIVIKTLSDIYSKGKKIGLKFSRVTDYPIGVKKRADLICAIGEKPYIKNISLKFSDEAKRVDGNCYRLKDRSEGRKIYANTDNWKKRRKKSFCRIRAYFCKPKTIKMPDFVESNRFLLVQ